MKINFGKALTALLSGRSPAAEMSDLVIAETKAELDKLKVQVLDHAKAGGDLQTLFDDLFTAIEALLITEEKKLT